MEPGNECDRMNVKRGVAMKTSVCESGMNIQEE